MTNLANWRTFDIIMEEYNVHTAKTHFSQLLEKVADGEEIIISKGNTPVAILKKYEVPLQKRKVGQLKGKVHIAPDFDEFGSDLQEMFGLKA